MSSTRRQCSGSWDALRSEAACPSSATSRLEAAGFEVTISTTGQGARGTATGTSPSGAAIPGSLITLHISDGSAAPDRTPTPAPPSIDIPGPPLSPPR